MLIALGVFSWSGWARVHAADWLSLMPAFGQSMPPVTTALAFAPDGRRLAAGGDDHLIRIIDLATRQEVARIDGHQDWVRTVQFSPDGSQLASAGNDGRICLRPASSPWTVRPLQTPMPAIAALVYQPSGDGLVAVGFQPEVLLLEANGSRRQTIGCDCSDLRAVTFAGDGKPLLVAGRSGSLYVIDASSGRVLDQPQLHRRPIRGLAAVPDSSLAISIGEDGRIVAYDVAQNDVYRQWQLEGTKLTCIAAIDALRFVVGGTDDVVRVFDLQHDDPQAELAGHRGTISALAASNELIVSAGFDATLRFWPLRATSPLQEARLPADEEPVVRTSALPADQ
jgi:WD40 repeat protein